jgi:aminomethyltransferase
MPVSYEGVKQEHLAVRNGAGLFDVSHMGEIETRGPEAEAFLRHLLSNDIARIAAGKSQYALLCREDGGVLDDLFTYRFEPDAGGDRFLTVVNASNSAGDFEWFAKQAAEWGDGVEVIDRSADYSMLALQGPQAIALVEPLIEGAEMPARFGHIDCAVTGVEVLLCRTGYTGEDGVELLAAPADGVPLWRALIEAGATPAGLGARDTLRLEACYPLYGNELTTERSPIEAGLKWACALDKDFIGVERLREQAERGTEQKLVPFVFTGPGIPRTGCAVLCDGEPAGTVTSGTLSPTSDTGIGMAYLRSDLGQPGRSLEVDVRGKIRPAVTAEKPLYRKEAIR